MGDLTTAASITAGGSLTGGLVGGAITAYGAKRAEEANRKMLERQINWEKERATHAHQWEMQDLRAAGINPILAAQGGAQTSAVAAQPSTLAEAGAAQGQILANSIGGAAVNAANAAKTIKEIDDIKSTIETRGTQKELYEAQKELAEQTAKGVKEETAIKNYLKEKMNTFSPKTAAIMEQAISGTGALAGLLGSFSGIFGTLIKLGVPKKEAEQAVELVKTYKKYHR